MREGTSVTAGVVCAVVAVMYVALVLPESLGVAEQSKAATRQREEAAAASASRGCVAAVWALVSPIYNVLSRSRLFATLAFLACVNGAANSGKAWQKLPAWVGALSCKP